MANKKTDLIVSVLVKILMPVSGLILVPIYLRYLSTAEYGYWIVLMAISSYLQLANMGIAQTVANHVAKNWWNKSKTKSISRFVSTAWVLYWAIVCLVIPAIILVGIFYPTEHPNSNNLLIITMAVCALLALPFQLFTVALNSSEHIYEEQLFQLIGAFTKVLLFIIILGNGLKLLALVYANAFTIILPRILSSIRLKKVYPDLQVSLKKYDKRLKAHILTHSAGFLTIQIAALLVFSTDSLVIGYFLGVEKVPQYALPAQLIGSIQGLIITFCTIYIPTIARLHHQKKYVDLQKLFGLLTYIVLQVGIFASIFIITFGEDVFKLLTDKQIYPGDGVFIAMIALMIIQLSIQPADVVLMSTSNHKTLSYFLILEGVLNIILSIWWVQLFGILGVILATLCARMASVMYIQVKLRRVVKIPMRKSIEILYMSTVPLVALVLYSVVNVGLAIIEDVYLNTVMLVIIYIFALVVATKRYLIEAFIHVRGLQ